MNNDIFETLQQNYIIFESNRINIIIDINEIIWFNANEITKSLGYKYTKDAIINNVDKSDKIQLQKILTKSNTKKHPHSIYINESGLYSLMLSSRLPKAKKFKKWTTSEVIPSIRKYGYYKLKTKYENKMMNIIKKINYLEKQNEKIKNDLKKEKYPDGGLVYVIDYSEDNEEIYRIGMTNNINKRKKIYDTHSLHKKNIVYLLETECPLKLETCVRSLLYDFRFKDRKDFYVCDLKKIKKAFRMCKQSISCLNQSGGNVLEHKINNLKIKQRKIIKKIRKLNVMI